LGNYVFEVAPKNVLPTLHKKTHFKACETIMLGNDALPNANSFKIINKNFQKEML
jgi:hypothetical protein